MSEKHRCAAKVYHSGMFIGSPCSKPGTFHERGEWWCHIHAPSKKKAKDNARQAKYNAERDRDQQVYDTAKQAAATIEQLIGLPDDTLTPAFSTHTARYTGGLNIPKLSVPKVIEGLLRLAEQEQA